MQNTEKMSDMPSIFNSLYIPVGVLLALSTGLLWLAGYGPNNTACSSVGAISVSAPPMSTVATPIQGNIATNKNTSDTINSSIDDNLSNSATGDNSVSTTFVANDDDNKRNAVGSDISTNVTTNQLSSDNQKIASAIPQNESLYFAVSSTTLRNTEKNKLNKLIDYLKSHSNARVTVSGYHDPYGNATLNEKLAHGRALAVQKVLLKSGVQENRIEMTKPVVTVGSGSNYEARRVEVSVSN